MSAAGALASLTKGFTPEQLLMMKDQNHDAEVYTVSVIFSVLAILAVAVRVSSRHMKSVAFGIDDALVVIAMVCSNLSTYFHSSHADFCTKIIFLAQTVFICVGMSLELSLLLKILILLPRCTSIWAWQTPMGTTACAVRRIREGTSRLVFSHLGVSDCYEVHTY